MAQEPSTVPLVHRILRHHHKRRLQRNYWQSAVERILRGQKGLHSTRLFFRDLRKFTRDMHRACIKPPLSKWSNKPHRATAFSEFFAHESCPLVAARKE